MGPLGSRAAMLTGYRHRDSIWIVTGCFIGSIEDFETKVRSVHGNNRHGAEYAAAITYLRAKFSIAEKI